MTPTGSSSDGRRGKAALFVVLCGWAGVAPHWLEPPTPREAHALTAEIQLDGAPAFSSLAMPPLHE